LSVLPVGFGSGAGTPVGAVERSLRFNPADSAYLNRTLGTSNRRTFTFSAWVKRSLLASDQHLLGCIDLTGGNNRQFGILFQGGEYLNVFHYNNGTYQYYPTAALYRDPSAWYHVVVGIDTTQATGSNRAKIYVNGVLQATNGAVDFTQNTDLFINSGLNTGIGTQVGTGAGNSYYFGGYMAEVYFIDGQALTPSSFGETDSATGVWKPKAYTGTYGTNGFYLDFADNSGTTSTTLGADSSGNGNNWTPNNFSVTAGTGNDSLVDSPTAYGTDTGVGGSVRGNYATLNPLGNANGTVVTYSNGNLNFSHSASAGNAAKMVVISTLGMTSGKWYWEYIVGGTVNDQIGITTMPASGSVFGSYASYTDSGTFAGSFTNPASAASYTTNDVIGMAYDQSAGTLAYYKNNTLQGTVTNISTTATFFAMRGAATSGTGGAGTFNFGQRAFAYTAPSGFKALCTQNLTYTHTIGATSTTQANDYFNAVTYTGNGTSLSVTGVGFQPDLIWIKDRSNARAHVLQNAIAGFSQYLQSNATDAETTASSGVTAVGSDGFTVGTQLAWNSNTETYVAWNWNAGGSTVTNTSGTISAQVRANTTSGFSIVTYTGNGTAGATVGHGLGVTPDMIIVKSRSVGTGDWVVWHGSLTSNNNNYLILNSTAAVNTANQPWNNTLPTSSVFSLRTWDSVNQNSSTYVAYCFDAVAGYSAFGSYTGNGSTDGPFVYTGFRPRYVLLKQSSGSGTNWVAYDTSRDPYNVVALDLYPNTSGAEASGTNMDIISNGFKIRAAGTTHNGSGSTYIYAAFAETPAKFSLAR
jgi:hypothetical protein